MPEQQISVEVSANRCRICRKNIPPGCGLEKQGVIDPLCTSCMSASMVGLMVSKAAHRHDTCGEQCPGEAIARVAKEDVAWACRKVALLHSAVDDLRLAVDRLGERVDAVEVRSVPAAEFAERLADVETRLRRLDNAMPKGTV